MKVHIFFLVYLNTLLPKRLQNHLYENIKLLEVSGLLGDFFDVLGRKISSPHIAGILLFCIEDHTQVTWVKLRNHNGA